MRFARGTLLAPLLALVVGCGSGSDGDSPGGGGGSGFTAVIDGQPWAANALGVTALAGGVPGGIVVVGSQMVGDRSVSVTLNLGWITGPGTYALGVGPGIFGGTGSVGESMLGSANANVWLTPLNGVAGTVTLTTLGGGRIAGTFQFTGAPDRKNPMGGARVVTAGKIDLPLTGTISAVPENMGARLSAVLGGKPYNAWSANARLKDYKGGAGVAIDTSTSENGLSLMLEGVTAPGTYAVSTTTPLRTIIAGRNGGDASTCCWGLNGGGDTGTITITSLSATRIKGTFSGILQPQPGKAATAPLEIVDGSFDVGVGPF